MNKNIKEKLIKSAIKDRNWIVRAEENEKNQSWSEISFKISLKILRHLRQHKMSQTDLAKKLGYSKQNLSKKLKGKENFTLETIDKFQKALDIKLIEVPMFEQETEISYENIIPTYNINTIKATSTVFWCNDDLFTKQEEILLSEEYHQYEIA